MASSDIVALYASMLQEALPFAIIFWLCDLIVTTFLRAAFGGKLTFRGTV